MSDKIIVEQRGKKEFTVDQGLKIQGEHLAEWESKLHPECYKDLVPYATETNHLAKTGLNVRRGSDLSTFVANWYPNTQPEPEVLFENVKIEEGDLVRTQYGDLVVDGFYYHLSALFVTTQCGRTIKGYGVKGVIKKK